MSDQRTRATAISAADRVWIQRARDRVEAPASEHVAAVVDAVLEAIDTLPPVVPAERQTWERRVGNTDIAMQRVHFGVDATGHVQIHEAVVAQLLHEAGWERTA